MRTYLNKIYKKYKKILDQKNYKKWVDDFGDEKLKFDYDLTKDSIIFELGAFKGGMLNKLNNMFGSKIYAFEPSFEFYTLLKNNFQQDNIYLFQNGVSSKNEKKKLIISNDGSYIKRFGRKNLNYEIVNLIKLSEFIKNNHIENIDLININIEGSEYVVLDELIKSSSIKKIEHLQIQFHRNVIFYRIKRYLITKKLKKTHNKIWCYDFIWERWDLKK